MYKIINSQCLIDFWQRHPETKEFIKAWYFDVKEQSWQNSADVLLTFPKAILEDNNRISFPIVLNHYFLMGSLHYNFKTLVIRCVGSLHQLNDSKTIF